ncbi:MAG TPA: hypothetical protein PK570_07485, partial [Thermoanaerobaculia bacterium]|nr:hypothetical protein [Thermoanaerobaculia bacterium]
IQNPEVITTALREGAVLDEAWMGRDRFARTPALLHGPPLPAGVRAYALAATTAPRLPAPGARVPGDRLVPLASALGLHRSPARDLGIPVVLAAARQGRGIGELLAAIADVATGRFACRPPRASVGEPRLERAVGELERLVRERFPGLGNARWVALRLLEGDARIVEAVRSGRIRELERPARRPEAMP